MSSSSEGPVLNSSPTNVSPARRRRSISPSDSDITSRPAARHSPTFGRSYDPHDPQVRERQRTMDVDMALQLSLARRDTISSPTTNVAVSSPFEHRPPSQVLEDQAEMDADADADVDCDIEPDLGYQSARRYQPSIDGETLAPLRQPSPLTLQTDTITNGHHHHDLEEPSQSTFGLPTYQDNVSQSEFDFTRMEEFASAEKTRLGLNTPLHARFSLSALRGAPPKASTSDAGKHRSDSPASERQNEALPAGESITIEESSRPVRQRKVSQSVSQPKVRKGIGGKMALFESNPENTSLSTRLATVLSGGASGLPSGPSYDHIAGVPTTSGLGGGILTAGHDRPYRFSFYSNSLSATIHARSLSELPAEGQTFEQLFMGIQPQAARASTPFTPKLSEAVLGPKERPLSSLAFTPPYQEIKPAIGENGTGNRRSGVVSEKLPVNATHHGDPDVNTWWLDVQNPTDEEMKMLSKVFSIHPLTTEDILMEETREKIELFRNYYLVCFRSFDQDPYSPTHLEPLNMYIIVFREGILSFHFRPTPHPQNVRRRIKQLKDYISVTSDWISYALIDDITDAFGPLIQSIEYEVDSIDELVLILKEAEQSDMLRRIGTCRKKVMGLLRLMGNKADVVKGLAKRCNENWRVAPTSDIGLYLSDIQDHLITMTQNLNHYEKILSRSHSNYLAQISIEMTDANNQINDVLSKLTALGTVLIPMNLVTGLWGMNVHVPGEGATGYAWFASIIALLAAFAVIGGYSTYKLMVRK